MTKIVSAISFWGLCKEEDISLTWQCKGWLLNISSLLFRAILYDFCPATPKLPKIL